LARFFFGGRIEDWRSGKLVVILLAVCLWLTVQNYSQGLLIQNQRAAIAYLMRHVCFGER
jgi:hypothetical protein